MNRPFIIGATPKQVRREDNITGTPMEMPGGPLTSRINSVVNLQPILRSFPVILPEKTKSYNRSKLGIDGVDRSL